MRTCGVMPSFIPFGWSVVFKCQYLGVELLQVEEGKSLPILSGKFKEENES